MPNAIGFVFFATSYSYSKHFIYAFNGRDHKKGPSIFAMLLPYSICS